MHIPKDQFLFLKHIDLLVELLHFSIRPNFETQQKIRNEVYNWILQYH